MLNEYEWVLWQLNRWWLFAGPCEVVLVVGLSLQMGVPVTAWLLFRKPPKRGGETAHTGQDLLFAPSLGVCRPEVGMTHGVGREPEGSNPSSRCHANAGLKSEGVARRRCQGWRGSPTPRLHAHKCGSTALRFPEQSPQPVPSSYTEQETCGCLPGQRSTPRRQEQL